MVSTPMFQSMHQSVELDWTRSSHWAGDDSLCNILPVICECSVKAFLDRTPLASSRDMMLVAFAIGRL